MGFKIENYFSGEIPIGFNVDAAIALAQSKAATLNSVDLVNWFSNMIGNNHDRHLPTSVSWEFKQISEDYADFGNFWYGFVGGVIRITPSTLKAGAGFAQGVSDGLNLGSNIGHIIYNWGGTYGDNSNDTPVINSGIDAVKRSGLSVESRVDVTDFILLKGQGEIVNINGVEAIINSGAEVQCKIYKDGRRNSVVVQSAAETIAFDVVINTLAGTTNAGMYTATEVTNTNTGEAQYIIRHNGTGEAVASGDSYVVNANDTITTTSGNTQFTHGLSDGRLRVMQSAVDSGLVVGKEGNDIHFGAGSSFTVNGHTVKVTTPLDAGATQEQTVQGGVLVQLAINKKTQTPPLRGQPTWVA